MPGGDFQIDPGTDTPGLEELDRALQLIRSASYFEVHAPSLRMNSAIFMHFLRE